MPSKKKKDDELEEEALAEWLSRGLAMKEFTMEKMLKLWMEEGDDDEDDGEDALAAKQELIQSYNVLGPIMEQTKEVASELKETAIAKAKHLWATAKHYAEIPPLRRRRLLREHVRDVRQMDTETQKYAFIKRRFLDEYEEANNANAELQFGLKKRNKNKAPLLSRFHEMKQEADKEQHARILADIEQKRRERMDRELLEKQQARDEKEQFAASQLVYKRQMNMKFWKKQLAEAKAFSEQQMHAQDVKEDFEKRVKQMKGEIQHMQQLESDDARRYFDRNVTKSSIGVFDMTFESDEWNSAVDGGFHPGMDEHTIGVTSARGFIVEHEVKHIELMETQSKVQMLQEKLEQIEQVKAALSQDRKTIFERKDKTLAEIKHISDEYDELGRILAGPPRRDPNEEDKMQFHVLVTRKAEQMKQLTDLNARLDNIQKRESIVVRSEQVFIPQLRTAQESEAKLQELIDQIEAHRHDLPMVVGRSIFTSGDEMNQESSGDELGEGESNKVTVAVPFTDPNALLTQVTMESKLELLKNAAIPVREHYKTSKRLSTESWKWTEHKVLAQQELEATKTRLAYVRDRFVEQHKTSLRADLMQAITRYHQGGNKLRKCIFPLKGYIEWWQHHVPAKSLHVCFTEELNGMHLEKPHIRGQLKGSFRFPKRCGYRVELSIRLQSLDDFNGVENGTNSDTQSDVGDAEENTSEAIRGFKFYIGSDFDSLQEFVFRDVNGKVLRTGDLIFEHFGNRICFCFEFSLLNELAWREKAHFVVSNVAKFEERIDNFREEEQRIRLLQQETHFVSELVKTIRMQSKQSSSERCADLLKELAVVDKSHAKTWDSKLLHGHKQRFNRVEYSKMLRVEIKKEVTHQIDQDVTSRKARGQTESDGAAGVKSEIIKSKADVSRFNFLSRKFALIEPQLLKSKDALGDYCSFKSAAPDNGHTLAAKSIVSNKKPALGDRAMSPQKEAPTEDYRKESMILGLRFEWREAKSKLHVMHKLSRLSTSEDQVLPQPSSSELQHTRDSVVVDEWCQIENTNAVYLASAFGKALKVKREEEVKARTLDGKKEEQLLQLQNETHKTILEEQEAVQRELNEDKVLQKQRLEDLARRKMKLHSDAIRLTTYNESVSSQIDFQVQRRVNALAQEEDEEHDSANPSIKTDEIVHEVKESYAKQFVEGRLALANKTWKRKEKRIADKREKERREREFRIRQESKLAEEISAENKRELAQLQAERDQKASQQLIIPNFQLSIQGQFPCEHRDVKNWGTKYDMGVKCKKCGKEMSKSFDEPNHTRGVDPELDFDVEMQRGHDAGGPALRFKSAVHLAKVENERLRLEKEARSVQLSDAVLYDRMNPKAIDEFNFRHGLDRGVALDIAGSDPLYPRVVHEVHHASFQDNVLFHGRLRNFHFRINQLNDLYAHFSTLLAVQRDFLENVHIENKFVTEKLPLIERDHGRAVHLIEEDSAALKRLEKAKEELAAAQKEKEAANHAIGGVEEEAEFAEFHVPALIKSSDEMQKIIERMKAEYIMVKEKITATNAQLAEAENAKAKTDGLINNLNYRTPGTVVRTKFGFAKVVYFRAEDSCVVLNPLFWGGTFFFPVDELLAYEEVFREEECMAMAFEENKQRKFCEEEKRSEKHELDQMEVEDRLVSTICNWRMKKEQEEALVRQMLEKDELKLQLQYELTGRKANFISAEKEARKLNEFARVSLKRRKAPARIRPNRLDMMRVTRASERRLAMVMVEEGLARKDKALRAEFVRERDAIFVSELADQVLTELSGELIREVCAESIKEGLYASKDVKKSLRSAIIPYHEGWKQVFVHTKLGFDRLWVARKKKYELLRVTWQRELSKLDILKKEIAKREEIRRLKEEERIRLESRRKEMLTEEQFCREFYVKEMVLCMRERKAMASAEMEMREYLRQLEIEAMKTKYAKTVEDRNYTSDKAARRLEIKLGKNEKHRLHREWLHIKEEDDFATQIRERELALAQAEALERQFDKYLIQQAIDGKVAAALEASRLQERVCEAQRVAAEKRTVFEAKLAQQRMMATVATFHTLAKAEFEWMETVERAAFWLQRLVPLDKNLRQLEPELERILKEREHVVADAKMKRELADACQARLKDANGALEVAIKQEDECSKAYKKIHFLNATMDSEVIHGRPQRFKTLYLREQLHNQYFLLLTESIIRRAIVECSKREVVRLEEKLKALHEERVTKSKEVGRLKRKHRRAFHLTLRRAELGILMFGGSQRKLLKEKFQQWVKLWSQRVMVRASFELKHSLILQQQKIRTESTLSKKQIALSNGEGRLGMTTTTKLSILHDHQKRRLECRLCKREYSEEQNNRYACLYHPGAYELACVRSCITRKKNAQVSATSVTASCMMHRARRWLCCDETDEGRFGSSGCARRYHMPTRANPELEQLVSKKTQEEKALLEQIDQQLLELKERNVVGKMKGVTKSVITKIERDLAEKRSVAAKYHTLDRR